MEMSGTYAESNLVAFWRPSCETDKDGVDLISIILVSAAATSECKGSALGTSKHLNSI